MSAIRKRLVLLLPAICMRLLCSAVFICTFHHFVWFASCCASSQSAWGWQGPEVIWVDDSDIIAPTLRGIFPDVIVLEDSTHLMRRIMRTLTPGHGLNSERSLVNGHSVMMMHVQTCCRLG